MRREKLSRAGRWGVRGWEHYDLSQGGKAEPYRENSYFERPTGGKGVSHKDI